MVLMVSNSIQFEVSKTSDCKAEIKWSGLDENSKNFHYEVEVSRSGHYFTGIGSIEKNQSTDHIYKFYYSANGDGGVYFFRIKQIYSNGYSRFTDIKSIELESTGLSGIRLS